MYKSPGTALPVTYRYKNRTWEDQSDILVWHTELEIPSPPDWRLKYLPVLSTNQVIFTHSHSVSIHNPFPNTHHSYSHTLWAHPSGAIWDSAWLKVPGIEPPIFWLVADPLYLLSQSHLLVWICVLFLWWTGELCFPSPHSLHVALDCYSWPIPFS